MKLIKQVTPNFGINKSGDSYCIRNYNYPALINTLDNIIFELLHVQANNIISLIKILLFKLSIETHAFNASPSYLNMILQIMSTISRFNCYHSKGICHFPV